MESDEKDDKLFLKRFFEFKGIHAVLFTLSRCFCPGMRTTKMFKCILFAYFKSCKDPVCQTHQWDCQTRVCIAKCIYSLPRDDGLWKWTKCSHILLSPVHISGWKALEQSIPRIQILRRFRNHWFSWFRGPSDRHRYQNQSFWRFQDQDPWLASRIRVHLS